MATLKATLVTTGLEIDETPGNNTPVDATVTFQESATDLSITASPLSGPLVVNGDTRWPLPPR